MVCICNGEINQREKVIDLVKEKAAVRLSFEPLQENLPGMDGG